MKSNKKDTSAKGQTFIFEMKKKWLKASFVRLHDDPNTEIYSVVETLFIRQRLEKFLKHDFPLHGPTLIWRFPGSGNDFNKLSSSIDVRLLLFQKNAIITSIVNCEICDHRNH